MNKDIIYAIKAIDSAYNKGYLHLDLKKTKVLTNFCKLLSKEGIIYSFDDSSTFFKAKFNIFRIYLIKNLNFYYSHNCKYRPYTKIKPNFSALFKRNVITYFNLKKIFRINILYLLSTDYGFITCRDALNLRIGGIIVCKIWL